MKFRLILTTLLSFLLAGTAYAFSVNFDADGTNTVFDKQEIWGFDTEGVIQYEVAGQLGTTYIVQDLGNDNKLSDYDTFTEKFTTLVTNGVNEWGAKIYPTGPGANTPTSYDTGSEDLKIDINLSGYIYDYQSSGAGDTTEDNYQNILDDSYYTHMNAGDATMYIDINDNNEFDASDIQAATFSFVTAADSFLADSVWPDGGGSSLYSVVFELDTGYNTDFWSDASSSLADLVANGFVLTYNDGSAHAVGVYGSSNEAPSNALEISFSDNGIDVKFGVVPEPATFLLFGIGLLGLAGISRKKA